MTVKLVVLYTRPDEPATFDEHFLGVHKPLAAKIPGVQRVESGPIVAAIDGQESPHYRLTELYFADEATLRAAFDTDEGKATAADYADIAPPGSRMFVQVVDE